MPKAKKEESFTVLWEGLPDDGARVMPEEMDLIEAHLPELLKLAVTLTDSTEE